MDTPNIDSEPLKYYETVLGLERPVTKVERSNLEVSCSKSRISAVKVFVDGKSTPTSVLYEKTMTDAERAEVQFPKANHHEAVVHRVFRASEEALSEGELRHYVVAKYIDHRYGGGENTIVTEAIAGENLSQLVQELSSKQSQYRRSATSLRGERREQAEDRSFWAQQLRKAYITVAVRGIADLVHDLGTELCDRIENELGVETQLANLGSPLQLYNPLEGVDNGDYYETKFRSNLEELLETYLSQDIAKNIIVKLERRRMMRYHPLVTFKKSLKDKTKPGNLIIGDGHPGQLTLIQPKDLAKEVSGLFERTGNPKYMRRCMEELSMKVIKRSKVGVIDLGDLRLGPQLIDLVDLTRNQSFDLKQDEVEGYIPTWVSRRQTLSPVALEGLPTMAATLRKDLPAVDIYRLIRAANKSPTEVEKAYYVRQAIYRLQTSGALRNLAGVIRTGLAQTHNALRKRILAARSSEQGN